MSKFKVEYHMPAAYYHKTIGCSATLLKAIRRSPAHAAHAMRKPSTVAMDKGDGGHCLFLDGASEFANRFFTGGPVNPKTNKPYGRDSQKFADWMLEHNKSGELTYLTPDEITSCERINAALRSNKAVQQIMDGAQTEVSAFWTRQGCDCKCRFDILNEKKHIIADLKTTQNASAESFFWDIKRYLYDVQAAWYMSGSMACSLDVHRFIFIAVESSEPYGVGVYEPTGDDIDAAAEETRRLFDIYKGCVESLSWPCYPESIEPIGFPRRNQTAIEWEA